MAWVIVLDSGPLGVACRPRGGAIADQMTRWRLNLWAHGALIVIPEIADYEVRRELLRAGVFAGLERLDALRSEMHYAPINTAVMREAARLWADARRRGLATADDRALDGDVIVAAQARLFVGLTDRLTVATDNPDHLARYVVDARPWSEIDLP
jgi:predicted nucleic acid-binding protein